jgi:hypothetical protein
MWSYYLIQTGIRRLTCKYSSIAAYCFLIIYLFFLTNNLLSFRRQAQDRAHRIGQKREVQVFRLVTEDTIEQKIVERAQQKLKLDAMVVQQGRLKDQDNKLSRDELLDAIRFGADKIFKSKDSSITDDDVSTTPIT